jgi:hypothetical protein
MRRGLLLASALCALGACGAAPVAVGNGTLTIGGTAVDGTGFVPLTGDQLLVAGAQGGFHVWLKVRVRGGAPGKVDLHRTARRSEDDRLLLQAENTLDIGEPNDDGVWELHDPYPTFLCPTPLGVDLIDRPVRFHVTMSRDDGSIIDEAESEATPRCPTDGSAEFCQRICAGDTVNGSH